MCLASQHQREMDRRFMSTRTTVIFFVGVLFSVLVFHCKFARTNDTIVRPIIDQSSNERTDSVSERFPASSGRQKWISQIFVEVREQFVMVEGTTEACKRDFDLYARHLQNQTIWAVRMLESSQWPDVGLFAGMTYHLGNFDECLMISAYGIKGKYCLVDGIYSPLHPESNRDKNGISVEWPGNEFSAWKALQMFRANPIRLNREKLHWALCVPSSCTSQDVEISLRSCLTPVFSKYDINITTRVDEASCQVHQNTTNYPQAYFIARMIFRTIFCTVVMATVYDILLRRRSNFVQKDTPVIVQIFRGFSIIENTQKLVRYSPQTEVVSAHFVKIIIMLFCIYGHRFMYLLSFPSFDTERVEMNLKNLRSIKIIHIVLVDVFFMYSGYLLYQLNSIKVKGKGFHETSIVLSFFLILDFTSVSLLAAIFVNRLVPTFAVLILFIANILPYASNGPLWHHVNVEAEFCRTNWLVGVLAVNNMFDTEKLCFWVSWFVSVDFQLTVIGSILLLLMARSEKIGLYVCGIIYAVSTAITFVSVYKNNILGVLPQYLGTAIEFREKKEFTEVYVSLCLHVAPYLMGFLSPVVINKIRDQKYEFSSLQTVSLAVLTISIGEGFNVYGSVFYDFGKKYNALENAIYICLRRTFFILPFFVLHILKISSGLGFVMDNIVEQPIYVPLGRLSYSAFLTNTILHMYHVYSQRTIMASSLTSNQFWWFTTDVVYTYFTGFLLYLSVEAPCGNIAKVLVGLLSRLFDNVRTSRQEYRGGDPVTKENADKRIVELKVPVGSS